MFDFNVTHDYQANAVRLKDFPALARANFRFAAWTCPRLRVYLFIRAPGAVGEGANASTITSNYAFALSIYGHLIILHVSLTVILAALAAVYAVKKLDLGVYHQMLRGAVYFGECTAARF